LLLCDVYPDLAVCADTTPADCTANPTDRRCAPPTQCDNPANRFSDVCNTPVDCVLLDNFTNPQCIFESVCDKDRYKQSKEC